MKSIFEMLKEIFEEKGIKPSPTKNILQPIRQKKGVSTKCRKMRCRRRSRNRR